MNVDRDYAYINFATLSKFFDPTLAVAEQILLCPAFPEEELRTYAAKRRQRLAVERAKIDVKAREAFALALFGERHPYGVSSHEEAYDSLTRDDVAGFYRRFYTAENCFVVCSGRIGDHELKAVAELAGRIPRGAAEAPPAFPAPETTHTAFVEYPGAVQSSLRIGRLLFPRTHPDFLGMQVVATALGGYFGSRLMQNLREEHGYTYGVVSAMVNFEREGYFAIAAQVGADVTQEALREIYAEIERLGAEPMPEAELELVKNLMNETGIPSDAVYRHYDICSKNCPSQIQKRGDWERFQRLIRETEDGSEKSEYNPGIYRVTDPALNIRTGPGVEYPVVGVIKDQGSYTITEIRNKSWGRLLSGAGWINCHKAYCFYGGRV